MLLKTGGTSHLEQMEAALSTGKRYFLYGAFDSILAQERETSVRLVEMETRSLALTPEEKAERARLRVAGFRASTVLALAVLMGDYRAPELLASELVGMRMTLADPMTSKEAWRTLQEASQRPNAPITLRTFQPRPLPPLGED